MYNLRNSLGSASPPPTRSLRNLFFCFASQVPSWHCPPPVHRHIQTAIDTTIRFRALLFFFPSFRPNCQVQPPFVSMGTRSGAVAQHQILPKPVRLTEMLDTLTTTMPFQCNPDEPQKYSQRHALHYAFLHVAAQELATECRPS